MKKLSVCLLYLLFLMNLLCLHGAEASTLRVASASLPSDDVQSRIESEFRSSYPDVEIVWQYASGDIKQAMLFQDSTVDIYFVSSRFGDLQNLTEKGYYMDMSSSALITERVALLHEKFMPLVTNGTIIYAYPWSVTMGPMCSWDNDVAEAVSLPSPADKIAIADMIEWERDVTMLDDPDYAFIYDGSNNSFIGSAFDIYKYRMLATTGVLKYNTKEFRELLARLDAYTTETDPENDPKYVVCGSSGPISGYNLQSVQSFLPMTIHREDTPVIGAYLNCILINPYSEHTEAALALVETIATYQDKLEFAAMSTVIEPIMDTDYDEKIAGYQQQIEQYQSWIAAGGDYEQYRDFFEDEIARYERQIATQCQYLLSQEAIDYYQQKILPYVFLLGSSIYETSDIEIELFKTYSQYTYGIIDGDNFLEKMDNKLMMMAEEQQ